MAITVILAHTTLFLLLLQPLPQNASRQILFPYLLLLLNIKTTISLFGTLSSLTLTPPPMTTLIGFPSMMIPMLLPVAFLVVSLALFLLKLKLIMPSLLSNGNPSFFFHFTFILLFFISSICYLSLIDCYC